MSEHEGSEPTNDEGVSAQDELLDDQADAAEDFLNDLLVALGIDGEAAADIDGDWIYVDVSGDDMAVLIGRHGATLDALQDLTRTAVQNKTRAAVHLTLDIEGYRERQDARLEDQARRAAERAKRDRRSVELDPMTSYERRIVHEALRDVDGVMTRSEGEDPDRRIVIVPQ